MKRVGEIWSFTMGVLAQLLKKVWDLMVLIYQNREHIKEFFKKNIWRMCLVLSICSIIVLLHLNAKQRDLILLQDQLIQEQRQHIKEQNEIIQDVIKTKKEMQKVKPKLKQDQLWRDACIFVGKCRAFEIPLSLALISAEAETAFYVTAVGPYGERGTHQATYRTMRSYYPNADATKLIYWEIASWAHLKVCYEKSGHDLFLTLAYHNAGMNWRQPERAMWVARKHISRCRNIRRKMDLALMEVV